jgi:elongation factor Ts
MSVTAKMVKELRERTGAGMMDCKKALVATAGDIEKAIDEMRKSGQAKADKKSSRTAAEGAVVVGVSKNKTVLLEVNCETDFVARDDNFLDFAKEVAKSAAESAESDVIKIGKLVLSDGKSVEESRKELVNKIGENIQVRRAELIDSGNNVGSYIHSGKIGVIVEIDGPVDLGKDIAMHIAASSPVVVSQDDVPADLVAREKEIFIAQAAESGKPKEIIEKMVGGRLRKYLDEVSLLGQAFVKDPNQKVSQILKSANAKVVSFKRLVVGEGIEKKESNFAEEVMNQVHGG